MAQDPEIKARLSSAMYRAVERIPAPMLVILTVAAVLAFAAGIFLKFAPAPPQNGNFPAARLMASNGAVADERRLTEVLTGTWGYQSKTLSMGIKLSGPQGGQLFEWVLVRGDLGGARFYARGSYRIQGDVLILQQRDDMGAPRDPGKFSMKYLPMAFENVNLRVSAPENGTAMTWTLPAEEAARMAREFFLLWPDDGAQNTVDMTRTLPWTRVSTAYK